MLKTKQKTTNIRCMIIQLLIIVAFSNIISNLKLKDWYVTITSYLANAWPSSAFWGHTEPVPNWGPPPKVGTDPSYADWLLSAWISSTLGTSK